MGSALDNPAAARDLDLACEGVPGWKFFELCSALEDTLGVPFDLVPLDPPTPFPVTAEELKAEIAIEFDLLQQVVPGIRPVYR